MRGLEILWLFVESLHLEETLELIIIMLRRLLYRLQRIIRRNPKFKTNSARNGIAVESN